MSRLLFRLAALVLITMTGPGDVVLAQNASPNLTFLRIATGATGGTYFPIGTLIAGAISSPPGSRPCEHGGSCGVPGMIAVAQTTQGSVENVELIWRRAAESGFCQADVAYWAFYGERQFERTGPIDNLRAIARLYPELAHLVVRRDAGIDEVADLRGRRISLGERESGTVVDARLLLQAFGLRPVDYVSEFLKPGLAVDALRDGEIDALFLIAGAPVPVIASLAEEIEIDLLPLSGEPAENLVAEHPFFTPAVMPGESYQGVGPRPTVSVGALWLISADIDENLVYQITRSLWHERTRALLDSGHPQARRIRLESALNGVVIPLHAGAERYYREAGMLP